MISPIIPSQALYKRKKEKRNNVTYLFILENIAYVTTTYN